MGKAKFSMIFKIDLNIVHGFMNATFIYDGYEQWSSTINVHSYIYEHTSCMINDHRNSYDHWSSMIIDHNWHSNRSMIVAMECCWSYMISVDQWVISWSLLRRSLYFISNPQYLHSLMFQKTENNKYSVNVKATGTATRQMQSMQRIAALSSLWKW